MKTIRLGTRRSPLAQAQSQWVAEQLRKRFSEWAVELVLITTSGDEHAGSRRAPGSMRTGGLKTLFTKEIEDALLDRRIDLAVHSMKDMPAQLPPGLVIAAVPGREDPRDAWVSRDQTPWAHLRKGAVVATGAIRRQAQIRELRPDIRIEALRGNVDTRLRKLKEMPWDGIILACAGLRRLGLEVAAEPLSVDVLLPAIGQGALAIETREDHPERQRIQDTLDDSSAHACVRAERALLQGLGGSCQTPIAGHAVIKENGLHLVGWVSSRGGNAVLRASLDGPAEQAAALGQALARRLIHDGADRLLAE